MKVNALGSLEFILLTKYQKTMDIGEEFYLTAITSSGKSPTWKSSDSKIASVNTYGKIIAKKAGTATITAKISQGEASCKLTVRKTDISLSQSSISLECDGSIKLTATTSNQSDITFKSNKRSIATIDEYGNITAVKPGKAIITASADGSSTTCQVTVKAPKVTLSKTKISLYRMETTTLGVTVSSGKQPTFKSNKSSVALVDSSGTITAMKHGTATITVTIDGISKTCQVTVQQPTIALNMMETTLSAGQSTNLTATVSSKNTPIWSSSNTNIATVDSNGKVTARAKGRAYIYAKEDGVSARCTVYVTE